MSDLIFFVLPASTLILDGTICKCSKIRIESKRENNKASISAVHIRISKRTML